MEHVGETVLAGRYEIGPPLGRGGMAEVFEGVDQTLMRPVAVKMLYRSLADDDATRQRFAHEARAAARLSHPNVVAVFDTGEAEGQPFLVMERLPGRTFADELAQASGPLDTDRVLAVVGDVLGALDAAHRAGVVHRDVKPANLLLTEEGCAKVADFGIAKSLDEGAAATITAAGSLVGTPAYIGPERLLGDAATPGSDIYSVGVILYEALSGVRPYTGTTPIAVATAARHGQHIPLAEHRPDLPAALVAAVEMAMAPDPADRPSARALATALGAGLAGDDPSPAPELRSPDRMATVVMPRPTAPQGRPARTANTASRSTLNRRGRAVFLLAMVFVIALGAAAIGVTLRDRNDGGSRSEAAEGAGAGQHAAVVAELERVAARVASGDGPKGPEAATRLRAIAAAVSVGKGAPEAEALIEDAREWRSSRQLFTTASGLILDVLRRVPGVETSGS